MTRPRLRGEGDDAGRHLRAPSARATSSSTIPTTRFSTSVERLIEQAVDDPDVLAIKHTIYRTSGDSPMVPALIRAAEQGKQAVVLVELKARFDEARNIGWARALERAGVHVVHGFPALKTHAKCALVVRREHGGIRRYVHIGTGNYHPRTARLYTDAGLFTCRPDIAADVSDLFNYLTGFGRPQRYRKLLVAPTDLRERIVDEVRRVTADAAAGSPGRIVLKMNGLVDRPVIESLYEASQAGVQVDLVVRSICCLRPGVPGLSENIRVVSVLGRFLEHERLFAFHGEESRYFLGSADMMPRNLDSRVEVLAPVEDPALRAEIDVLLETSLSDTRSSFQLQPDGTWERRRPAAGEPERSAQEELMARALEAARVADEEADREEAAERIVRAAKRRGEELEVSGKRYAVIDVGTNTVRLLVAEQVDGRLVPAHTDKELVRLGRDLAHDGRISDQSLLHVSDALRQLRGRRAQARRGRPAHHRDVRGARGRERAGAGRARARRHRARARDHRRGRGGAAGLGRRAQRARRAVGGRGRRGRRRRRLDRDRGRLDRQRHPLLAVLQARLGTADRPLHRARPAAAVRARARAPDHRRDAAARSARSRSRSTPRPSPDPPRNLRRLVGPLLDVEALERAVRILCEHPSRRIARRFELEQERVRIMPAGALILHACAVRLGVPLWFCKGGIREGAVLEMVAARLDRKCLMAPASSVELDPGEPLRAAARRVVAARADDLAGIAPGAVGASDPEALHDVRVAVRRLTSALDVFADGLDEEPRRRARRMLRRDAEPLGRARDLDVQIALVRRFLKTARTGEQAGMAHVLELLASERAEAEAELAPAIAALADPELQAALAEVSAT